MFNHIKGVITDIRETELIVEMAGLGFSIYSPQTIQFKKGETVQLQVYMHWNQEQGPSLFGFATPLEKKLFLLIISCSGIGPKIALALLSQMSPSTFIKAITNADLKALSSISGIGPKKAEQILVYLKHKIAALVDIGIVLEQDIKVTHWKDVADALGSLSYSKPEITRAMQYLHEHNAGKQQPFDELLRHALSYLSKRS